MEVNLLFVRFMATRQKLRCYLVNISGPLSASLQNLTKLDAKIWITDLDFTSNFEIFTQMLKTYTYLLLPETSFSILKVLH